MTMQMSVKPTALNSASSIIIARFHLHILFGEL